MPPFSSAWSRPRENARAQLLEVARRNNARLSVSGILLSFAAWSMGFVSLDARLLREFPKRHALSSNGTPIDEASAVLEVLDAFRNGRFRSFIL